MVLQYHTHGSGENFYIKINNEDITGQITLTLFYNETNAWAKVYELDGVRYKPTQTGFTAYCNSCKSAGNEAGCGTGVNYYIDKTGNIVYTSYCGVKYGGYTRRRRDCTTVVICG